jgi:diacylglycerol kinase (ATP)
LQFNTLLDSFNHALEGFIHVLKTQRNMKIHIILAFLVLVASLFIDISEIELIILFFSMAFVIAMELLNTAIEITIDMVRNRYSYKAKIAKNIAAAAVFIAAVNSILVGYLIFLDDLRPLTFNIIRHIKHEALHLSFINLVLLVIIIIILKTIKGKGTPLEGGMPSGHSAISFALVTTIIFLSGDILIASLVILLALMVVQSRFQNDIHNILEIITGALIGILLTIIIFQLL